jgi:hypothetical protein
MPSSIEMNHSNGGNMTKKQRSEIIDLIRQTLPFFIITATFIGLAYTYGHALAPLQLEDSFEFIHVNGSLISHK